MNSNRKFLLWGSVAMLFLATAIVFLFLNLSSDRRDGDFVLADEEVAVYNAIPSDAVVIIDVKHFGEYGGLVGDTLSPLYCLPYSNDGLVALQKRLNGVEGVEVAPMALSLHYSAKNSVSFLQILALEMDVAQRVQGEISNACNSRKRYNGITVYTMEDGMVVSLHNNLLLASSSLHVLESSIRHLENNTSILDKREFENLLRRHGTVSGVYINHNQIGKLFSGMVERDFLGYSDYMMKFTQWSCMEIRKSAGRISLSGVLDNGSDESRFSNILGSQSARKSFMGRILPASTMFAVSLPVSSMHEYLKSHTLYLEMQKKAGQFAYRQKIAQGNRATAPGEWVDSLSIEEIVSAYCKFGEKCEWITVVREKQHFGLNNVISAVVDRDKIAEPVPYLYGGYIASVFGELFSHCNEEYVCSIGPWRIIGPKSALDNFANGSATYFTLEDYVEQTPVKGYLEQEASVKMVANLKESGDSLVQVLKPYYRGALANAMEKNNFAFLTMDLMHTDGENAVKADFYSSTLAKLPEPEQREEGEEMSFAVDSTIVLPDGPFEVKDVAKKANAYLEQLPNMRLRYMDANKKGVWAIPFETPICGYVEQIDLYGNGRLQMLFASGDRLYLLDRLGRFVNGYPKKLPKKVVMGPKLVRNVNGIKYSILVLNEDNTVSWYDISGKPAEGWSDIVAPEFIKELPKFIKLGGKRYWMLKAPSQLLLYTIDGKRVEMQDKKKRIDRESEIEFVQDGILKVKCTDGKEYTWNLATGKTKRL